MSQTIDNIYIPNRKNRLTIPKIGDITTVNIPSEILRAEVVEVIDEDHIICKLSQPMSKGHNYQKDQRVAFHRSKGLAREQWDAD
jgi:hypothetical protein